MMVVIMVMKMVVVVVKLLDVRSPLKKAKRSLLNNLRKDRIICYYLTYSSPTATWILSVN